MCKTNYCEIIWKLRNSILKLRELFTIALLFLFMTPSYAIIDNGYGGDSYIDNKTYNEYKKVTKEDRIIEALETMRGGLSDYSRRAIMGENLTGKPIKVEFRNLAELNEAYADFDALGWKNKNKLYIFINEKHRDAPKEALAAVLSHEAIHQDELNSINEETYCWTLEAAVWTSLTEKKPSVGEINHPLVYRENTIKRMFIKGNYTDKYIRKSIMTNAGYQTLPSRSPGFEDKTNL